MKLCIPVNAPNGIESLLDPHLPSAEHLLFFDTETRLCEEIALRGQQAGAAGDMEIHAVLCGSINRVTLRTLIEQGIKVYGTEAQTVAQAIAQYENGELEAVTMGPGANAAPEEGGSCCGGGHGHGEGSGGCGGQGHGHESGACCGGQASACGAVPLQ
jgi:predicted Fe-Mo cluster-binding NifX family protein